MSFRDRNGNPVGRFDFEKSAFIEKTSNRPEDFCPVAEIFPTACRVQAWRHGQPLTLVEYSPVRVSMVISSPSSMKGGTRST